MLEKLPSLSFFRKSYLILLKMEIWFDWERRAQLMKRGSIGSSFQESKRAPVDKDNGGCPML